MIHQSNSSHGKRPRPTSKGRKIVSGDQASFLRKWDAGCKTKRRQLLQHFLSMFSDTDDCSAGKDKWEHAANAQLPLDVQLGHSASLLLSRFSSYMRLTYLLEGQQRGYNTSLALRAICVFLSVPSVRTQQFIHEIMSSGVLTAALEVLLIHEGDPSHSHTHALQLLYLVACHGRQFKETLCEYDVLVALSSCIRHTESQQVQRASTTLLLELATGNPQHIDTVRDTLAVLLPLHDRPLAQQSASQVVQALFNHSSPHFAEASMDYTWCDRLVAGVLGMQCMATTRIGIEAGNVAEMFAERHGTAEALGAGLALLVESRCVSLWKKYQVSKFNNKAKEADNTYRSMKREYRKLSVMIDSVTGDENSKKKSEKARRKSGVNAEDNNEDRDHESDEVEGYVGRKLDEKQASSNDASANKTLFVLYSVIKVIQPSSAGASHISNQHRVSVTRAICGPKDQTFVHALGVLGLTSCVSERINAAQVVLMLSRRFGKERIQSVVGKNLAELIGRTEDFGHLVQTFWRPHAMDPPDNVDRWSHSGNRRETNFELVCELLTRVENTTRQSSVCSDSSVGVEKKGAPIVPKAGVPIDETFAQMHLNPLSITLKELLDVKQDVLTVYEPF